MWPVTQKGTSWVDNVISRKYVLKLTSRSHKNSTPTRVSKRILTYYKTGSKAFFMLRFSAVRLSNILYDIKCPFWMFVSESLVENRPRSSVND